jgi:hypothetical protein
MNSINTVHVMDLVLVGAGLYTRYATQISLCRNPVKSTVISIIPWSDSRQDRKDELHHAFRHELTDFNPDALAKVIEKVGEYSLGVSRLQSSTTNHCLRPTRPWGFGPAKAETTFPCHQRRHSES